MFTLNIIQITHLTIPSTNLVKLCWRNNRDYNLLATTYWCVTRFKKKQSFRRKKNTQNRFLQSDKVTLGVKNENEFFVINLRKIFAETYKLLFLLSFFRISLVLNSRQFHTYNRMNFGSGRRNILLDEINGIINCWVWTEK